MLNEVIRNILNKGEKAVTHGNIYWNANELLSLILIAYSAFLISSKENTHPHCYMTDNGIEEFCHGRNTFVFLNISDIIKEKWQPGMAYISEEFGHNRRNVSFVYNMPWVLIFIGFLGLLPEWIYKKFNHGNLEDLLLIHKQKEGQTTRKIATALKKFRPYCWELWLQFLICEITILIINFSQFIIINDVLDRKYFGYGLEMMQNESFQEFEDPADILVN